MPMAFSQNTGLFYVPSNEWGMDIWNEPDNYKMARPTSVRAFTIKPNYEDPIRLAQGGRSMTANGSGNTRNTAPLWGGV